MRTSRAGGNAGAEVLPTPLLVIITRAMRNHPLRTLPYVNQKTWSLEDHLLVAWVRIDDLYESGVREMSEKKKLKKPTTKIDLVLPCR